MSVVAWVAMVWLFADVANAVAGKIAGVVVDPQGVPVANATVNAAAAVVQEATSDEQGRFAMDGILAGGYQLSAAAEAFVKVIADVALGPGEKRELQLQFRQVQSVRDAAAGPVWFAG